MQNSNNSIANTLAHYKTLIMRAGIFLLAIVVFGWLVYQHIHSSKIPVIGTTAYVNESLIPYKLHDLSFERPIELSIYSKSTNQVEFLNRYIGSKSKQLKQLYMSAVYAQVATAPTQSQLSGLNAVLQNPSYKYYSQTMAPINKFVANRLSSGFQFNLTNGKPFKKPSASSNAWSFDLDGTHPKSKDVPIHGQVIYIVGGRDQYYFMLYSASYDWTLNQSEWNRVFDSIQLSQS